MPRLQVSAPESSSAQAMPSFSPVVSMPSTSASMAMASLLPPPAFSSLRAISSMPAAFTPRWGMAPWALTPTATISARLPGISSQESRKPSWAFSTSARREARSCSRMAPRPITAFASAGTTLGRSPAYREYTGMPAPSSPPVTLESSMFMPPFSMLITGNSASGEKP